MEGTPPTLLTAFFSAHAPPISLASIMRHKLFFPHSLLCLPVALVVFSLEMQIVVPPAS